jgi:hypothetical protein
MENSVLFDEMMDALEAANKSSETLEKLLKEVKDVGRPSPELVSKVDLINRDCDLRMQEYVDAYRACYAASGGDDM